MRKDEKGIALIITMFLLATLSALAVSMMFLAQTETASSRNYRTMSQARYAAEAGVHEMANFLMTGSGFVPSANIDITKSPVTCTGGSCAHTGTCSSYSTVALAVANGCVVLGYSTATSNNPTATVHTPTTSTLAVNGSGVTNNAALGTVTFTTAAILLSQKSITAYGSSAASTLQTWYIISDGTVPPSTSAIVEVSATMEQAVGQAQTFALFATDPNCGAIHINGGGNDTTTDSYNSQNPTDMATSPPVHTGTQGGIGTNGNLDVNGNLVIGGTLTTPRSGTGACSNSNPNAITGSGQWSYGGTVPIGQPLSYPTPDAPTPTPGTTSLTLSAGIGNLATCTAAVAASGWACSTSGSNLTLTAVSGTKLTLPNISVGSNTNLIISGGSFTTTPTVNVNSFSIGNNATMSLATGTNVTMNIAGNGVSGSVLDLSGGGTVNPSFDPSRLQIIYGGTHDVVLVGNNSISATIYAPNANVTTSGHGDFFGSVLSSRATINGGASIHYDTSLATKFKTLGNHVLTSFSWKKY